MFSVQSKDFIIHPKFSYGSDSGFDVALLRTPAIHLSGKNLGRRYILYPFVVLDSIQYIRLATNEHENNRYVESECIIPGWGYTSDGKKLYKY